MLQNDPKKADKSIMSKLFRNFSIVALSFAFSMAVFAGPPQVASIDQVRGQVFILDAKGMVIADPQGKRGRKTDRGAPVYQGEVVKTQGDARVKLKFFEGGNEVVLGADTTLVVAKAGAAGDAVPGTHLDIKVGQVRSKVNQRYSGEGANKFEIQSSNAVAGVRGTVFTFQFDPKTLLSQVATEEGKVQLKDLVQNRAVMVTPGTFSAVDKASPPVAPKPVSENPELMKLSKQEKKEDSASSSDKDKSDSKSDSKGESKDSKGDAKSDAKSDSKADAKDGKSEAKSEAKADAKSDGKAEVAKTDDNKSSDSKADAKSDAKSDSKSEPKVAVAKKDDGAPPIALAREKAPEPVAADSGRSPASMSPPPVAEQPKPVVMAPAPTMNNPPPPVSSTPFGSAIDNLNANRGAAQNQVSQTQGTIGGPAKSNVIFK